MRRATHDNVGTVRVRVFQSTLSMRRATQPVRLLSSSILISIHALHEESDADVRFRIVKFGLISIHALHEESDPKNGFSSDQSTVFQSTLSMRRATLPRCMGFQYVLISIHALHEESDLSECDTASHTRYFNPRSP